MGGNEKRVRERESERARNGRRNGVKQMDTRFTSDESGKRWGRGGRRLDKDER